MDKGEVLKRKIIDILRKHPEGLTILELSRLLEAHRQTVSKYVLVLETAGKISKRIIGSAKLLYLKEHFKQNSKIERLEK